MSVERRREVLGEVGVGRKRWEGTREREMFQRMRSSQRRKTGMPPSQRRARRMVAWGEVAWRRRLRKAVERRRSSECVREGWRRLVRAEVRIAERGGRRVRVLMYVFGPDWRVEGMSGASERSQCISQDLVRMGGRFASDRMRLARRKGFWVLGSGGERESAMNTGRSVGYISGDGSSDFGICSRTPFSSILTG